MTRPPVPAHVRLGYAVLDVQGFGPGFAQWYRRVVGTGAKIPTEGLEELLGVKLEALPADFVPIAKLVDKRQAMADARAQVAAAYATYLVLTERE